MTNRRNHIFDAIPVLLKLPWAWPRRDDRGSRRIITASALRTLVANHREALLGDITASMDLHGVALTDRSVFRNERLRNVNFDGATLVGLNFGTADVAGASFSDADLTDADLSAAVGLTPAALSGTDLTRAKLPESVSSFDSLTNVEELSKNAGKLFLTILTSILFVLLTAIKVQDATLLTDSGTASLPVINVEMPVRIFFGFAPLVLFAVYVTLHLYLQRLWRLMATQPAIFPDGTPLDEKIYPWMVNDLVRVGFPRLRSRHTPLAASQLVLFGAIIYLLTPISLVLVWERCLCRHDPTLTLWQSATVAVTFGTMLFFVYLAWITLRRDRRRLRCYGSWRSRSNCANWLAGVAAIVIVFVGLAALSDTAIYGNPESFSLEFASAPLLPIIPPGHHWSSVAVVLLNRWLFSSRANIVGEDVTTKPAGWQDKGSPKYGQFDSESENDTERLNLEIPGASLEHSDLRYAYARRAFLVNADLRGAILAGADLTDADLRRADLSPADDKRSSSLERAVATDARLDEAKLDGVDAHYATLNGASLGGASLTHTNMRFVVMQRANLAGANLSNANLQGADLTDSDLFNTTLNYANLADAHLNDAWLVQASLKFARQDATESNKALRLDLSGAHLGGADLRQADLSNASLVGADIRSADLAGADLKGANLDRAVYRVRQPYPTIWPIGYPGTRYRTIPAANMPDAVQLVAP